VDAHAQSQVHCEAVDGILVVRLEGHVNPARFIEAMDRAQADPQIAAGLPMLIDASASAGAPDRAEMNRVVDYFAAHPRFFSGRRALVTRTLLQYGMARVAEAIEDAEDNAVRAFRNESDARAYLRGAAPVD
jgi:hypothetical protein